MNSLLELDEDRISRIRQNVMTEIEADRRARTRRTRTGAVALGTVLVLGGLGVATVPNLTSGSGSDSGTAMSEIAPSESDGARVQADPERASDSAAETEREVITRGTISLTVTSPSSTADEVSAWVIEQGGHVDARNEHGSGSDEASARLTVRLPRANVDTAVEALGAYGNVTSVSIDHTDVTAQGADLDARIRALQTSVHRLTELMAEATSSSKVLQAEQLLTERQAELDGLRAQRTALKDQTGLATIDIDLMATTNAEAPQTSSGFTGGLVDGWNALVGLIDWLVRTVAVLLPWLIAGALIYIVWRLGRRVLRR